MAGEAVHTLPKRERLCGRTEISRLLNEGRYGNVACLRYCYRTGTGLPYARLMVSVSKRNFKRAVRRNLIKRRLRESYRQQKQLLPPGTDVLLIYQPREVLSYAEIDTAVGTALREIAAK